MQEKTLDTIQSTTINSNSMNQTSYLQQNHQNPQSFYMTENIMESFVSSNSSTSTTGFLSHTQNLVYNFSILKEKIQQLQPLVGMAISQSPSNNLSGVGTLIQEVIVTASSMMYAFQQLSLGPTQTQANPIDEEVSEQPTSEIIMNFNHDVNYKTENIGSNSQSGSGSGSTDVSGPCDIIELHASELLAKYTHYCQVCGKGFKRDANLRMHMRAHGDEYKTNAALTNPNPLQKLESESGLGKRKYSCPHEGCRWNKKHTKFQPLKSVICVKNHYKRSHCPKMYVCNRCNRKQFSVLSDLRTHEKHCGDLRWVCSCGTTFSRKDKLMGHVSLFEGHVPVDRNGTEMLEK